MIEQLKLSLKLSKYRSSVKNLFGEKYLEKIEPYQKLLKEVSASKNCEILKSLIHCLQLESVQDNGMAQLLFCAAAVEIIEPTKEK